MNERVQRIVSMKQSLRQEVCSKSWSETFRQLDAMHELREHQKRFRPKRRKKNPLDSDSQDS